MNKEKPTPHEWGAGELRVCLHTIFTQLGVQEEIVCNPNIYNEQQAAEFAGDL